MKSVNLVVLMGNLTKKPELRRTPAGLAVADFGLAISEKYKNKEDVNVENVCFVDIIAWGKQAETCSQFLVKGSLVAVEGKLQLDHWQTAAGEKRYKLKVRAMSVQFISSPRHETAGKREFEEEEPAEMIVGTPF